MNGDDFCERKYQDALTAFVAGRGQRYELTNPLTWWAAKCGRGADAVIADLSGVMTDFSAKHASDIRRGVSSAVAKIGTEVRAFTPSRKPRERKVRISLVRELIDLGGRSAKPDELRNRSPIPTAPMRGCHQEQTAAFLSELWNPDELLYVFGNERHRKAERGRDLRTRDEWIERVRSGAFIGDCLYRNPLTGLDGVTGEGKSSLIAAECVSSYRYALVEFDHLPIVEQCAFWVGFLSRPNLARHLSALTFSGGKSIHGLIRTNASAVTAPTVERSLRDLFCTDGVRRMTEDGEIFPFRADPAGLRPHGGTRLAGARRGNRAVIQELLYLAPPMTAKVSKAQPEDETPPEKATVAEPTLPTPQPAPPEQPPISSMPPTRTDFAALCQSCPSVERCRHAFGRFWTDKSHGGIGCNHPL